MRFNFKTGFISSYLNFFPSNNNMFGITCFLKVIISWSMLISWPVSSQWRLVCGILQTFVLLMTSCSSLRQLNIFMTFTNLSINWCIEESMNFRVSWMAESIFNSQCWLSTIELFFKIPLILVTTFRILFRNFSNLIPKKM